MSGWSRAIASLRRPYPVTTPMVVLVSLIPLYLFIPGILPGRTMYAPELALDRAWPLVPSWSIVYGGLYLFLIVLPVLTVREPEQVRRTVRTYLTVWLTAYVFFVIYPTVAPRPDVVPGDGFGAWGLRMLYGADPPHNCFPSLHVAHSFVSALTCYRLHRRLGIVALLFAALVAASTLFAKQHYLLDVLAGALLAWIAYRIFLHGYARDRVPEADREVAPFLAAGAFVLIGLGTAGFWLFYRFA